MSQLTRKQGALENSMEVCSYYFTYFTSLFQTQQRLTDVRVNRVWWKNYLCTSILNNSKHIVIESCQKMVENQRLQSGVLFPSLPIRAGAECSRLIGWLLGCKPWTHSHMCHMYHIKTSTVHVIFSSCYIYRSWRWWRSYSLARGLTSQTLAVPDAICKCESTGRI